MRFVIAALAAFLVLMFDFDGSSNQISKTNSSAPADYSASQAVSFAARFIESAAASDELASVSLEETPGPTPQPEEPASKPTAVSAMDAFCHALREAAETSGIPVPFFARLIWQESRFRSNEVSHAGARGVAQFMPETAAEVGLDDPFDPFKALPASAKLLRKLRDDFGNLGLAAAAYNAGSGRIQKWLAKQSELPRETRDYVRIITGTKAEDWIEDGDMLAIRVDLPRKAPCEGIGGLSKTKDIAFVSSIPAASVTALIRKAEAVQLATRQMANRARRRLALVLKKSKARNVIAARAAGKSAKSRAIRVASRARSSS
jgi:hypothetical protein